MHPAWYINVGIGALLQSLLFWRAFRCRLWLRYPLFYAYLMYTTLWSLIVSLPVIVRQPGYAKGYWWSHLVGATLRFGIAVEIYRNVFPRNSTVGRRAGCVILIALTVLASLFWMGGAGPGRYVVVDAARKIALSVAAWILVVLGLSYYYGIRIGRNMWGMAVGLLIFTGSELMHLAAIDLLPDWWHVWRSVHPIAYVLMLLIWTSALWGYYPSPSLRSLDESAAQEFVTAWQDRWRQVPTILRGVIKP